MLSAALGGRTDETLLRAWAQVPPDYRFLPAGQRHLCDKGTSLTSIVESLNTKWRQRQLGLVRRSCGVHPRIEDDLFKRFRLLMDEHNRQGARQWQRRQDKAAAAMQSNP